MRTTFEDREKRIKPRTLPETPPEQPELGGIYPQGRGGGEGTFRG